MPRPPDDRFARPDVGHATVRDLERLRRRDPERGFWRALTLVGSVGWPIVLLSTGAALLGHWLDTRWDSGVRATLVLVTFGATIGTILAFRAVKEAR